MTNKTLIEIAELYHSTVEPCYQSKRAQWTIGVSQVERKAWPYRGAYKKYPAVWIDPAVCESPDGSVRITATNGKKTSVLVPSGEVGPFAEHFVDADFFDTLTRRALFPKP